LGEGEDCSLAEAAKGCLVEPLLGVEKLPARDMLRSLELAGLYWGAGAAGGSTGVSFLLVLSCRETELVLDCLGIDARSGSGSSVGPGLPLRL
jgi:hypothetical protein